MGGSLFDDRYTDPAGRLTTTEAEALRRLLSAYADRGAPAYVVIVPEGDSLASWRKSWTALDLRDERDLLVLHDGRRWEARGWGLAPDVIARALDASEPRLKDGLVPGLSDALGALRGASSLADAEVATMDPSQILILTPVAIAAALGLSGLGWVLARRMARARDTEDQVDRARRSLEHAVASLVLDAETLGAGGRALQDRAARLQQELRRVPADEAPYVRAARIRQLEDEVAALSSELLTRGRGGQAPARVPEG